MAKVIKCNYCIAFTKANDEEPCNTCVNFNNFVKASKSCNTCEHYGKLPTQEPCKSCFMYSNYKYTD